MKHFSGAKESKTGDSKGDATRGAREAMKKKWVSSLLRGKRSQ